MANPDDGCPLCGEDGPHEHIVSNALEPGEYPTYEKLLEEVQWLRVTKNPPAMAEWCKEEREKGAGGCGACSVCCGELRDGIEDTKKAVAIVVKDLERAKDWNKKDSENKFMDTVLTGAIAYLKEAL